METDSIKERILLFLRNENKSSAQFAQEIGVQPSAISHIISGRNKPSLDLVMKMLKRYPYLSPAWLLFGKGDQTNTANAGEEMNQAPPEEWISGPDRGLFRQSEYPEPEKSKGDEYSGNANIQKNNKISSDKRIVRVILFFENGSFTDHTRDSE